MAEEVQIAGSPATAKKRNPLGVLGLTLITLGIYYFFWWYFINREMRDLGQARGDDLGQNPTNSLLAITLGALIIVPAVVTLWTTSGRVEKSQVTTGVERPASGPVIFILLILIGPVGIWYLQHELNKVWELAGTGAAPAGLEGGAAAPPPQGQPAAPESRPEVPGQG